MTNEELLLKISGDSSGAVASVQELGTKIQTAFAEAGQAAQKSGEQVSQFGDLVERLTERFAIYEVLHETLDFTKEIIEDAAKLEDLSRATAISTEALQQLSYVGQEFGVGMDQMARGVETLSAKLASGDHNAVGAIQDLGLNLQKLLAEGPKDAFLDIADALGKVEDPMLKAALAADLFGGRLGKQLIPMLGDLRTKMQEVPQTALINEETIKSAHDFEVELGHLATNVSVMTLSTFKGIADGTALLNTPFEALGVAIMKVNQAIDESGKKKAHDTNLSIDYKDRLTILHDKINELRTSALEPLTAVQKANILTLHDLGDATKDIAVVMGVGETAVTKYLEAHKKAEEQAKKGAEAMKKLAEEVDRLAERMKVTTGISQALLDELDGLSKGAAKFYEEFSGAKQRQDVADLQQALDELSKTQLVVTQEQLAKVAAEAGKLFDAGATLTPQLADLAARFGELGAKATEGWPPMHLLGEEYKIHVEKVKQLTDGLLELSKTFNALGSALTGLSPTLGAVITDFGHMASAIDNAKKSFDDASKAFTKKDTLTGIFDIASGIGGIVTAAVDAGKAIGSLFDHFFGTAGRDSVISFAQTFGGFDQLHQKLLTLGNDGEQLWIKLTQGVGRNNPDQAKQVIDQINAALNQQDAYMQRLPQEMQQYGLTWEQAGHQAEQSHLDTIGANLVQTFADLTKAGFDISTVTQKMSGDITSYIDEAIRTGTEVPEAMKPLLQKMIDMGTLTDNSGNKITDLKDSGITFSETLTQGFQSVVDAINQMIKALTGSGPDSLNGALETIGNKVVSPHIKPIIDTPNYPGDVPGASTGALVTAYGLEPLRFALGGLVPQFDSGMGFGVDTVPAFLQPGEIELSDAQQRRLQDTP